MSRVGWVTRDFRYTARAGRGEDVMLWAVEVGKRFVPLTQLPERAERADGPYRDTVEVVASEEGTAGKGNDPRSSGLILEISVRVTAPAGTRFRCRNVFTDAPKQLSSWWDYLQAGQLEPVRRYRDKFLHLCSRGRLLNETKFRKAQSNDRARRQGRRKAEAGAERSQTAAAAHALLETLAS